MAHKSRSAVREAASEAARILASVPTRGGHLGDLLWWDLVPGWKADAGQVRDAHRAAGLDPEADWPGIPGYEVAFGRAVDALRPAMAGANVRPEVAEVGQGGEKRIAILALTRGRDVDGRTAGIVALPPGGAPYVERDDAGGWARQVCDRAATLVGVYTGDDARAMVTAVLDRWAATPCRQTPPHIVYWLPDAAGPTLRTVKGVLASVGAGAILLSPQHDGAEERESATHAANAGLEARISEFAAQVAEWQGKPPARVSTVEGRIAELDALRERGRLYRGILGDAVTSMDARIAAVEGAMRATLGIVEARAASKGRVAA